jgi:hypothetical protein
MLTVLTWLLSVSVVASAKTQEIRMSEIDLPALFAEGRGALVELEPVVVHPRAPHPLDPALSLAFFQLRAKAQFACIDLTRWFRPDHAIYVFDLIEDEDKAPLLEIFKTIDRRLEAGHCDVFKLFDEAPHSETFAKVAKINSRVTQIKADHKTVIRFATAKHDIETAQRYGDERYSYHLRAVRRVLKRFGFGPKDSFLGLQLGTAAWLHDILEDTEVTFDFLKELVGEEIARIVLGVTKLDKEEGVSDDERKLRTLFRTALLKASRILKLADRIANVEEGMTRLFLDEPTKVHKYIHEYAQFKAVLYRKGEADKMWLHLERLLTDQAYAQDFALHQLTRCAELLTPKTASGDRPGNTASATR